MPAVQTQLLADETDLAQLGPLSSALGVLSSEVKLANLRAASGLVLAAYGKRFRRTPGQSFVLAAWGDMTKKLVVQLMVGEALTTGPRGLNPSTPDGRLFGEMYTRALTTLNEIADITNPNARIDPDAVGSPDADDMGSLSCSEGGDLDEADAWANTLYDGRLRGGCR